MQSIATGFCEVNNGKWLKTFILWKDSFNQILK